MVRVRPNVWCDPCLVPLVKALYENGFPTVASCCGHGKRPSRVALADGREVVVFPTMEAAATALAATTLASGGCPSSQ